MEVREGERKEGKESYQRRTGEGIKDGRLSRKVIKEGRKEGYRGRKEGYRGRKEE